MKKVIALMLAFLMIFSFAACSSDKADENEEEEKTEKTEKKENADVNVSLDFGERDDDDRENGETETEDLPETEEVTEAEEEKKEPVNVDAAAYLICVDSYYQPFTYYDGTEYTGFDVELLSAVAEEKGFTVHYTSEEFETALDALANGDYDGMISAMTKTAERELVYDYSDAYFTDGIAVIVNSSSSVKTMEQLKGLTVGVAGDSYAEYVITEASETYGFTVKTFDDYDPMYESLVDGTVDAVAEEPSFAGMRIMNMNYDMRLLDELVCEEYYYFIVPKGDNPELLEMFNEGVAELKRNGKYDELLKKYGFPKF